jgi:predicted DNA-binding protein
VAEKTTTRPPSPGEKVTQLQIRLPKKLAWQLEDRVLANRMLWRDKPEEARKHGALLSKAAFVREAIENYLWQTRITKDA